MFPVRHRGTSERLMQSQHTKRADDASGRPRRGHLSKVLLIGSDDAFQSGVARRIFNGHPFRIVGRSTTLLDALARLESSTIDLVLLSREFREDELSLFALDAHRRGFAGLILHVASPTCEVSGATAAGNKGLSNRLFGRRYRIDGSEERAQSLLPPQPVLPILQTRLALKEQQSAVTFTARQQAVLARVSEGWTNQEIAFHLKCSEGSVKAVLQELFRKLGVRRRAQIVRLALEPPIRPAATQSDPIT